MTAQEVFYTRLTALAALCPGFTLTPEVIDIYDRGLADLGYEMAAAAIEQVVLDRSSRDPFPSVREIRSMAKPEERPEDEAARVAARIYGAIAAVGPYSSSIRDTLGEVAWQVVQLEGGWQQLCEAVTYDNATTYKAQWRRLAEAILRRQVIRDRTAAISQGSSAFQLPKLNSLLERIGGKPEPEDSK